MLNIKLRFYGTKERKALVLHLIVWRIFIAFLNSFSSRLTNQKQAFQASANESSLLQCVCCHWVSDPHCSVCVVTADNRLQTRVCSGVSSGYCPLQKSVSKLLVTVVNTLKLVRKNKHFFHLNGHFLGFYWLSDKPFLKTLNVGFFDLQQIQHPQLQ